MHLIIIGPQGSGKGTQADILAQKYGLEHISTGALFRAEITAKTDLGALVADSMNQGMLIPDEITNAIVREKVLELHEQGIGCILDGYPRTLAQAQSISYISIDRVLLIELSDTEAIARLQLRYEQALDEDKRIDDKDDVSIMKRLSLYHEHTDPIISYYESQGILSRINGAQPIPEVTAELINAIEKN